jgi:hypothetical protein
LWVNYYRDGYAKRQAELDSCLLDNLENPVIDAVYVLHASRVSVPPHAKLVSVFLEGRPKFSDFFTAINARSQAGDLNVIANSDIVFDASLAKLQGLQEGDAVCLSRHEPDGTVWMGENTGFGSDTWAFRGKVREALVRTALFSQGINACDTRLARLMWEAGYRVINPVRDVVTTHRHASKIRHYRRTDVVPGPVCPTAPTGLEVPRERASSVAWFNPWHLGDCIWHTHLMRRAATANPGLQQEFWCDSRYHTVLSRFLADVPGVCLRDPKKGQGKLFRVRGAAMMQPLGSLLCWLGAYRSDWAALADYWQAYVDLAYGLARYARVELPVVQRSDMWLDAPVLSEAPVYTADVLVINSRGLSGQWPYGAARINDLARRFADAGWRTVTTAPVQGLPCTADGDLDVVEIARIAHYCRYVLAVHTGPLIPCLNVWALANVERWWVCDRHHHFLHPRITAIRSDRDLGQLVVPLREGVVPPPSPSFVPRPRPLHAQRCVVQVRG